MAAPANTDALGLLSAALNSSDKQDEARHLSELYDLLKVQPGNIPILLPSLISLLPKAGTSLRTWIAQVMDLAFCRPALSQDTKATLAIHAPEAILLLIKDRDPRLTKIASQCFASMYPVLFRLVCNDRAKSNLWQTVQTIKAQVVHLFDHGSQGTKLAVIKCYQRIIQVQSRGSTDPRAQLKNDISLNAIPSSHPFLNAANLEEEGNRLFAQIVTLIFTGDVTDLIMASVNSLTVLAKSRPQLGSVILRAMATWTPASLGNLSHTQIRNVEKTVRVFYLHFVRNQLAGPESTSLQKALEAQQRRMEEAARTYQAEKEAEAKRKRERIDEELQGPKKIKLEQHQPEAIPNASTAQEADPAAGEAFLNASVRTTGGVERNPLAAFDVKTLPIALVIDLIIANLQALSEHNLHAAIAYMRANLPPDASTSAPPEPPAANAPLQPPPPPPPAPAPGPPPPRPPTMSGSAQLNGDGTPQGVKAEDGPDDNMAGGAGEDVVQDPLQMDMAEEDLEALEASGRERDARASAQDQEEQDDEEISLAVIENFALAPPEYLSISESDSLIKDTIARICEFGSSASAALAATSQSESGTQALWSSLVIRLATRGFAEPPIDPEATSNEPETKIVGGVEPTRTLSAQADIIRSLMLEFVKADFARRTRFAITWMAEEWFCDRVRRKQATSAGTTSKDQYPIWLEKLVQAWIPSIDAKDRSLAKFLADLPEIPPTVLDLVAALSKDKVKMVAGMSTLQDICISRPALRDQSADKLLQLTRTSERSTRARAIIAIKQCAVTNSTLEATILAFARSNLDILIETPQPPEAEAVEKEEKSNGDQSAANDVNGAAKVDPDAEGATTNEGEEATEEEKEESTHPTDSDDVLRFVELPFSLCTKIPDMLDEIFITYPRTPKFVQTAIETHIVYLIRALGPNHPRLLTLLRNFPDGADSLALCILKTLTEKNRTPAIVDLVKELVDTRDVDPRFLVPIMADLDKAEIMKRLPRVVTILASRQPEDRALIKSVFQSIVQMPPQGFGSVSSNLPRVRQTELLTPVELMGLLHHAEREIGLKNTVAAIQICFSMTDVYRSEVLAAVLNQISEDQNLPMLFMRTVIMAVSTYKSLSGYVARNLLSRLITKKIWQNPPLWDGFILCAKQTAPSSFGALIQLPKDQLREVVSRQPDLRTGLVEYLTTKAGGNRARLATFMDMLGPDPADTAAGTTGVEEETQPSTTA
ncbi:related to Symplekin [Ustilago trichophora]|uniref:Related to Symplekin n=1 Tax=Ustilago trichophora TaxID=86804 RepID=A0A5C3EKC2_9BASI|nr:related to Symplekin [Ustilago trichophora]